MEWTENKPDFTSECTLVTANKVRGEWEYQVWIIENVVSDEGTYIGWFTGDGEEYGDLQDLKADKYLILPLL